MYHTNLFRIRTELKIKRLQMLFRSDDFKAKLREIG